MEIIKRIYKQSAFVLIPAAGFSALIEWKKLPVSILIGGILTLANLKGLAWGVEGLVSTGQQGKGKLVFFSLFRLFIVFVILLILVRLRLINIIGILVGLALVLVLLLKEGFKSAREEG